MAALIRLKLKNVIRISLLAFCLLSSSTVWAQEEVADYWPREIETTKGVLVVYQPQPDKLEGNILSGLTAVALEMKDSKEPIFGAVWFEARLDTDRAERMATITDLTITQVRFPDQDEEKAKQLKTLLEKEMPKWNIPISMDRLITTLEMAETRTKGTQKINTDPPKIIFMTEPAVLITLDGKPHLQEIEGSKLKRVINTPFTILFETANNTYYLYADKDAWYTATDVLGDWAIAEKVSPEIVALAPKKKADSEEQKQKTEDKGEPGPPPKVIVAIEPTELISSTGKPEFTPLSGTDLLYMSNTDSDVLMDIKKQEYYILLSGRWFVSKKMEGPWKYVAGDKLPADFAKISEDSEMGTVLYAVPGTDVAKEAVLDAQIPQTASVDLKKATLSVEYDGEPKFETITGTKMTYAINTATPVIQLEGKYYACDEAIWFVSDSAKGPWQVATSIPDTIYTIPPDSPIYNVTYVRIYNSTPEVVYVGYTPGYTSTYVYGTTIVYGTGYWYSGWYGHYYYPRPVTWGFHVRWNPWTGWGGGFSYGYGPYRFAVGVGVWYRGGWWGPGRHYGYGHGYRHGYRHGARAGYRAGYRASHNNTYHNNIYRSQRNQARAITQTAAVRRGAAVARTSTNRANNVYADKNGNVHRKTNSGWENRSNQEWKSTKSYSYMGEQKAKQQKARPAQTQQLNRSSQARQQGSNRASSYNNARSSSSRSGASRGGGGRGGGGRGGGGRR